MKAAVLYGPKDLRVENVDNPKLEPDGIIVRVKVCGICGSDLYRYDAGPPQGRMGHEYSGEVVEVGANVTGIRKGDRVAGRGGRAFAEYMGIPQAWIGRNLDCWTVILPADMSYEVGATIEPISIGVNVARRAEPRAEDTVVVLGAGMIGQGTWQAFKAMGVSKVIVTELGKKRLEVSRALGADMVINAAEEEPVKKVHEITAGEGADIVAECAGAASTLQQATDMVRAGGFWQMTRDWQTARTGGLSRPSDRMATDTLMSDGGKIMLVATPGGLFEWRPAALVSKGISVIGCIAGAAAPAMDLMRQGKINTGPLITHEFPLEEISEAFRVQANPDEAIKVLIRP